MNYAAILAGGVGSRMGNKDKPKQYLDLGGKPIIVHTVSKFLVMPDFKKIAVLCPQAWIESTKDMIRKEFGENDKVAVIGGGETRNGTVMRAISFFEEECGANNDDVICTHDSVRPFVTYRIIKDNLEAMKSYDACDTVVAATDTIVISDDGKVIGSMPDRRTMYQGQTPQTFRIGALKQLYSDLSESERSVLTDACSICVLRGRPVALVEGETFNIKITYASDLKMAAALLCSEEGVNA